MIEKITNQNQIARHKLADKINELVDAVNEFEKDREEIKEWISILADLRSRVPVVESRVSILEEHAENSQSAKITQGFKNLQDHRPNMVMDDPFGPHPNIYEQSMRMDKEFAEDECARLQDELERTRKALDVAVKRLGYIKNNYKSWTPDRDEQMIAQATNGLDEIKTALEQKD